MHTSAFLNISRPGMLLILFFVCGYSLAQKKIKVRYEYDAERNVRTGKPNKDLYRICRFDRQGNMVQIITFGQMRIVSDTIHVALAGGGDSLQVVETYPVDRKKTARVENFNKINDSLILSNGYEIWNRNDTLRFANSYQKDSPSTYVVNAKYERRIPMAMPAYRCDLNFLPLPPEEKSTKYYNQNQQLERKVFTPGQADESLPVVVFYRYDQFGRLAADSTLQGNECINKTIFIYNRKGQLSRTIKSLKRSTVVNDYFYNENGDLIKKKLSKDASLLYQYQYY